MFFSFLKVHIFSFVLRPIFVLFYVLNVMFFYICNVICGTILFLMFNLILSVCTIPGNMWILFDLKFPLRNDACVAHHDKNLYNNHAQFDTEIFMLLNLTFTQKKSLNLILRFLLVWKIKHSPSLYFTKRRRAINNMKWMNFLTVLHHFLHVLHSQTWNANEVESLKNINYHIRFCRITKSYVSIKTLFYFSSSIQNVISVTEENVCFM